MKESKIKKIKLMYWLPALVLAVGIAILSPVAKLINTEHYNNIHQRTKLNAVTYSQQMIMRLKEASAITAAMEQIVINDNGEVKNFEVVAKNLITDDIQCVQLAPNGVVNRIYPLENNEAGMIDLLNDPERGEITRYSRDHNEIVMQGPFELKQGGFGIAVRNPVYLSEETTSMQPENFWGFTIAIIKVPQIFEDSVSALSYFGYDYILTAKSEITQGNEELILSTKPELDSPETYSFVFGCHKWTLEVTPAGGWNENNNTVIVIITGVILILLISFTILLILIIQQNNFKNKTLATMDPLTGLLNRAGERRAIMTYFKKHPDETCVGAVLDIDNFKVINDLYGHAVGDAALKHLTKALENTFPSDTIIARVGGDEFNFILKNTTIDSAAEKIKDFASTERLFRHNGTDYTFTISIGYSEYPTQAKNISELSVCSDVALYEAKLRGRNCCVAYDERFLKRRRFELGFALKDISENLPSAFLIYRADVKDDTMLFANNEMIKLAGCRDLEDFMIFCGRKFSNLIHPDERKTVESSIWRQINTKSDGANDYVKFRLATKSGEYKQVFDHGRIVDSVNYGRVFYVLIMDSKFIESHFE